MSRTRHRNTMIRVLAAVLLIPCFRLQSISSALKSDKEKKHALKAQAKQQMEDADIDESSASKRVHWIFIHYHKTGKEILARMNHADRVHIFKLYHHLLLNLHCLD